MAYSEPYEALDEKTREIARAIKSLCEELEAINWYNQRVATTHDPSLKEIMAHNRDEEIEHACMAIEWLRRNMDKWDDELRSFLFTSGSLVTLETGEAEDEETSDSTLAIGSMKS